jgi:hypothetical protein
MSDGHGLAPIVFLGLDQSQWRGNVIVLVTSGNALIQMRDWCASGSLLIHVEAGRRDTKKGMK